MSERQTGRGIMLRLIEQVEYWGNKLPNPFWLFCILLILISGLSVILVQTGVTATRPETQVLKTGPDHARDCLTQYICPFASI